MVIEVDHTQVAFVVDELADCAIVWAVNLTLGEGEGLLAHSVQLHLKLHVGRIALVRVSPSHSID